MKVFDKIVLVILIIGGLNWGLVGVANFDLVAFIFGVGSVVSTIVYILVGLSALWLLKALGGTCCTVKAPKATETPRVEEMHS